ncbi:MAG: M1 family peptidase [Betaproteobacteria bacterium]|nr:MAG: M1 family peptidase [Betaproteobacteria bacterium]
MAEPLTVVSNMPVARVTPRPDGRKEVSFARSVPMPTYLVALFIGELDVLQDELDGIALAIYTVRGKAAHAQFAMQATKDILRHFNDYFGERYLLPKLDQVALPGGFGGAMENWGAILYNESLLLVDPQASSLRQQQRVFGIVAHEIAHQWFGNLVTMAWWDNLWLNEGFATWMATRTAERFHPQWRSRLRAALNASEAMAEDARRTTHPVQTPVHDDARAFDLFDAITYTKGEAFLHMLEAYLGEGVFRDGVRRYLRAHRLSNATTADLWHHLAEASGRDVRAFAAPWVEQPGLPRVDVSQRCEDGRGVARLEQRRFTLNDPQAAPLAWPVPVTLLLDGGERRRALLGASPIELRLDDCRPVHVAGEGYFRVRYDGATAQRLARQFARLGVAERQRLLGDTFALVQAGETDLADYLRLLEATAGESDRFVLAQAIESFAFLRNLLDAPRERAAFDDRLVRILRPPLARIGWSAQPGEDSEWPTLRAALIRALGLAGDPEVVREARALFAAHATQPIKPAIRGAVLDVVGRHADAATFERLLGLLRGATAVEHRWEFQSALRHATDPALRLRWWNLLLEGELPPGEATYNLQFAGASSDSAEEAWQFLLANLARVYAKASPRGRSYVLPEAASAFSDASRADELIRLTRQHLDAGALYQAEKAADAIRLAAAVKARQGKALRDWVAARGGA